MKNRIIFIDYVRIICTFMVVCTHGMMGIWQNSISFEINSNLAMIVDIICHAGVPVFFMISGALITDKQISYKRLYCHHILKFVFLLVITVFGYALFFDFLDEKRISESGLISHLNAAGHIWFLAILIGIYILQPVLRKIYEDPLILKYLLVILICIDFCIYPALIFAKEFAIGGVVAYLDLFSEWFNGFSLVSGYIVYYFVGKLLLKKEYDKAFIRRLSLAALLSVLSMVALSLLYVYFNHSYTDLFERFLNILMLFPSVWIFAFCKNHLNRKTSSFIRLMSDSCIYVYLIHIIIMVVVTLLLPSIVGNIFVDALIRCVITFVISMGIVILILSLVKTLKSNTSASC